MAKKNYYAVKTGKTLGIYKTWDECQEQISGFSGALFQGFSTLDEANEFLGIDTATTEVETILPATTIDPDRIIPENEIHIYVDGSYRETDDTCSYGVVALTSIDKPTTFAQRFHNHPAIKQRNITGEVEGAICALDFAKTQSYKKITIFHDYLGIGHWGTNTWKANTDFTRAYRDKVSKMRNDGYEINFVHVKGHTGDKYNEMCDQLATEVK